MKSNFPIDAVITFVDSSDPVWKELAIKNNIINDLDYNSDIARYCNDDTLELVLLSIEKFAPWIRTIHLIVQSESQVPEYAKGKVNVILHKDYIPNEYLPCYNSCMLETFFPLLPDCVAEHFIYFNDDMIFTSDIKESQFFDESGKPIVNVWSQKAVSGRENPILLNCYNLIIGEKQSLYELRTTHGPSAFRRDFIKGCFDTYKKELLSHIHTKRTSSDVSQYVYSWYQKLYGECDSITRLDVKCIYAKISCYEKYDWNTLSKYHIICMNSPHSGSIKDYIKIVKEYLLNS